MSTLYFYGRKYDNIPGTWNDLKPEQLITIAGLLHSRISPDEAVFRVIMSLLEIRKRWRLAWKLFLLNSEERLELLADLRLFTDFIFDDKKIDLTKQILPVITVPYTLRRSDVLYGPPDKCRKLVFMEFIKAETYYLMFRNNFTNVPKRMEALNKLVSVLYRHKQQKINKATWNGDIRETYNDNIVTYRAEKITSRIPDNVKYAILLFYIGCRQLRVSRYKFVFGKSSGGSGGQGGWIDAIRSMAGGARHMEEMAMVDADLALYDLDKLIEESTKQKRKSKK